MAHNLPEWSLADRLRKIRRDRHLSQAQFAEVLGVKAVTYSAWEAGRTHPHDVTAMALTIEQCFGVPAAWVLGVLGGEERRGDVVPEQRRRRWDDFRSVAAA